MFNQATVFNNDISSWDVSAVMTMESMFNAAEQFEQKMCEWNLEGKNVQNMFTNSECTVDECVGCTSSPTTSSFPSAGPFLFPSSFPSSLPAAVLKSAKGHKTPKSSKKGKGGSGLKSDKAGNMIKTPTSSKSA